MNSVVHLCRLEYQSSSTGCQIIRYICFSFYRVWQDASSKGSYSKTSLPLNWPNLTPMTRRTVSASHADIGLGAESVLKVLLLFCMNTKNFKLLCIHSLCIAYMLYAILIWLALQSKSNYREGELSALEFRRDCIRVLSRIMKKIQEKSPLQSPTVREIACLDPTNMMRDPEWCKGKMKSLVQRFLQDQQLTGGVLAGRNEG